MVIIYDVFQYKCAPPMYSCVTATLEQLKNAAKTVSLRYSIVVCLKKLPLKFACLLRSFGCYRIWCVYKFLCYFFISMDTTVRDLTRHPVYKSHFIFWPYQQFSYVLNVDVRWSSILLISLCHAWIDYTSFPHLYVKLFSLLRQA